jgi:hypothetical protein
MLPASAKSKGRELQNKVCALLRASSPDLQDRDIKSTAMGANGVDIQLSSRAVSEFPLAIECKNIAAFAGYVFYDQACSNAGSEIPAVVVKANGRDPLIMLSFEDFVDMLITARESHAPYQGVVNE